MDLGNGIRGVPCADLDRLLRDGHMPPEGLDVLERVGDGVLGVREAGFDAQRRGFVENAVQNELRRGLSVEIAQRRWNVGSAEFVPEPFSDGPHVSCSSKSSTKWSRISSF